MEIFCLIGIYLLGGGRYKLSGEGDKMDDWGGRRMAEGCGVNSVGTGIGQTGEKCDQLDEFTSHCIYIFNCTGLHFLSSVSVSVSVSKNYVSL